MKGGWEGDCAAPENRLAQPIMHVGARVRAGRIAAHATAVTSITAATATGPER